MSWEKDLQSYAEQTRQESPTAVEAQALLARARRQAEPSRTPVRWMLAAGAVAAMVAIFLPGEQSASDVPVVASKTLAEPVQEAQPDPLRVLDVGRTALAEDVVDVSEGGQVTVLAQAGATKTAVHTRLRLDQGSARFEVSKRTGDASFTVEAQTYSVRVVGTAFEVHHSPFSVVVSEGVVEVADGLKRWTLRAGERFAQGRVHRAPEIEAEPALPELTALRRLVLGGQLAEARAGMQERLSADSSDVETRILGAQLETKLGNRAAAVTHWERVIARGSSAQAQRARYEAAVLLSGQPAEAESHLRAFLQTRGPLSADARLRLARALLAQGKDGQAKQELERLIADHPGTTPARVAGSLLK